MKLFIKICMIAGIIFIFFADPLTAYAEESSVNDEMSVIVDEMLSENDISFSYEDIGGLSISDIVSAVSEAVTVKLRAPIKLLFAIISIVIFCSFTKNTVEILSEKKSQNVYDLICIASAALIISEPLFSAYEDAAAAMDRGGQFMTAFIPIYVGIIIMSGGVVSGGVYNGITLAAAEIMVQTAENLIMPLLTMLAALAVTGSVFPETSVDSIITLVKKFITWGMTAAVTLFSGFVSLKTAFGSAVDSFTVKSAKFVMSGAIPVVGSAISDAYTTVRGSFDVMRSTTGTAGAFAIILLFLPPVIEVAAFRAAVIIGASAADMFDVKPVSKLLRGLDSGLAIAMSILICFGILFIISTAVLIKASA